MDLASYMDVMTSFKCKLCPFTTSSDETMEAHVKECHLAQTESVQLVSSEGVHLITTPLGGHIQEGMHLITTQVDGAVQDRTEVCIEETVSTQTHSQQTVDASVPAVQETFVTIESSPADDAAQSSLSKASSSKPEVLLVTVKQPGLPSTSGGPALRSKELYLCAQCNLDFNSLSECQAHLLTAHRVVGELGESEPKEGAMTIGISATEVMPGKTSIATQIYKKKPGRKRKVTLSPKDSESAGGVHEHPDYYTGTNDKDDEDYIPPFYHRASSQRKRKPNSLLKDYLVPKSKMRPAEPEDEAEEEEEDGDRDEFFQASSRKLEWVKDYVLKCSLKGCKAKFKNQSSLDIHLQCHTEKGDVFKCVAADCDFVCLTWGPMKAHLWRQHKVDTDLLKCDVCDTRSLTYSQLVIHQQVHSDRKNYICDICERGFKLFSHLKAHLVTHSPMEGRRMSGRFNYNKSVECNICKRTYNSPSVLAKHLEAVHDKVKHFICQYCGHTTSRKAMMQLHLRTHTGEKPHKCDQCNYATGDHNSLRRHKMRHSGKKPYKCPECSYACIQAISLKLHLKSKHPDATTGVYSCSKCTFRTVNKTMYENHMKDHENGLIVDKEEVNKALEIPPSQLGNIEISTEDLAKLETCYEVMNGSVTTTDLICTALNAITNNLTGPNGAPQVLPQSIETSVTKTVGEDGRLMHKITFALPDPDGTRRLAEVIFQQQPPTTQPSELAEVVTAANAVADSAGDPIAQGEDNLVIELQEQTTSETSGTTESYIPFSNSDGSQTLLDMSTVQVTSLEEAKMAGVQLMNVVENAQTVVTGASTSEVISDNTVIV